MSDSSTSTAQTFRLLPLGDAAVTVEFGNEIDPALNERVIAFADGVRGQSWEGIRDVVPTYRSVTIHVDPLCVDASTLTDRLFQLSHTVSHSITSSGMEHRIPVFTEASGDRTWKRSLPLPRCRSPTRSNCTRRFHIGSTCWALVLDFPT